MISDRVDMRINWPGFSTSLPNKEVKRLFVRERDVFHHKSVTPELRDLILEFIEYLSQQSFVDYPSINPAIHIGGFVHITQRITSFKYSQTKRLF